MTREEILSTAKPILFNTDMVRAIQDGRKAITRRVVKPKSPKACGFYVTFDSNHNFEDVYDYDEDERAFESPQTRLHIGDYLYVREMWREVQGNNCFANDTGNCPYNSCDEAISSCFPMQYEYKSDNFNSSIVKWKPSIHMPKKAARIFLRVTGVRVERLQDIITGDYRTPININKEGLTLSCCFCTHHNGDCKDYISQHTSKTLTCKLLEDFTLLWNSTVKKTDLDKYGWDANPWVWVIEFERVEVE